MMTTRDSKSYSPSTLLALARTRRMQRALAHAYLYRGVAMPTLRTSLGYMVGTACVTDGEAACGYSMRVLGLARAESVVYVVEEPIRDAIDEAPILSRLYLDGPRAGHHVPVHAWYEAPVDLAEVRARIAAVAATLEPVMESTPEAWMLSTRVVQRRALRLGTEDGETPIRKFALQLQVEPVGGLGPHGKTTVTAFLRPSAQLVGVVALSTGHAVARVRYTGIPSGVGLDKETVVLLGNSPGA